MLHCTESLKFIGFYARATTEEFSREFKHRIGYRLYTEYWLQPRKMDLLTQELSKLDDERSNLGSHVQQINVELSRKKLVEVWLVLWSNGEIIGVQRNESNFLLRFNQVICKEHQKALFLSPLRKGYARRIEFHASLDVISGKIARNTTPWCDDEWELEELFKVRY